MVNFRSENRGKSGGRPSGSRFGGRSGGFGGRSRGGFGGRGFRGRDSGRSDRRPLEMHDVVCSKCGKQCQVPFKPTGNKPVLCRDCFRNKDDSSGSRNQDRPSQSGASSEQFNQINAKLDKIIKVLQDLEMDEDSGKDLEEDSETE